MFVLLFTFVFGGVMKLQLHGSYVDYLMPGIFVQAVLFGSTQTGIGLAQDLTTGMFDRFRSLPMARSAVLGGRTLADGVRNLLVVLLVTAIGAMLGFRFHGGLAEAVAGLALVVAFGLSFSWLSAQLVEGGSSTQCPCVGTRGTRYDHQRGQNSPAERFRRSVSSTVLVPSCGAKLLHVETAPGP